MRLNDILGLDDNRIKMLDYILETCNTQNSGFFSFVKTNEKDHEILESSAGILAQLGYISIYSSNPESLDVRLKPEGEVFIKNSSFMNRKEERKKNLQIEKEKLQHARTQHMVNERALGAAKREPWIILWGVISTLATILVSIFK